MIVQGVNVGAQSYFDALATMLIHTRGALIMTPRGSMVLTGRAALEASGAVSAEDEGAIGGFERIMGPNGEAQYFANDLADAYRVLYEHYRFTYVVPGESGAARASRRPIRPSARSASSRAPTRTTASRRSARSSTTPATPGRKRPFPMRAVMEAVIDQDGGHLERWRPMVGAETAIVWDAHLGGTPVCLIGIESRNVTREGYRPFDGPSSWNAGTLFPLSSKKVARAINAASGNRPLVVLANLSGFDGSPESMRKLQLEYGAEIARAVVNFEGPISFVVVSRYHGGAYVVFSQALNAGLRAAALEGSYASVIGGGPAAAVVFGREVRARALADARVVELDRRLRARPTPALREQFERVLAEVSLEKQTQVAAEFDQIHTVERARSVGSLTAILPPADARVPRARDRRGSEARLSALVRSGGSSRRCGRASAAGSRPRPGAFHVLEEDLHEPLRRVARRLRELSGVVHRDLGGVILARVGGGPTRPAVERLREVHHRLARALAPAVGRRKEVAVRALAHHALGRARAALDQVVGAVAALLAEKVEQAPVDPSGYQTRVDGRVEEAALFRLDRAPEVRLRDRAAGPQLVHVRSHGLERRPFDRRGIHGAPPGPIRRPRGADA